MEVIESSPDSPEGTRSSAATSSTSVDSSILCLSPALDETFNQIKSSETYKNHSKNSKKKQRKSKKREKITITWKIKVQEKNPTMKKKKQRKNTAGNPKFRPALQFPLPLTFIWSNWSTNQPFFSCLQKFELRKLKSKFFSLLWLK